MSGAIPVISIIGLAIGICAWRVWSASREKIRKRKPNIGPPRLPYWAGDRKP